MSEIPTLVVVGRTNKGKSSIVATLAEIRPGERLVVGVKPGTTRQTREYPLSIDGREVARLVDTPGLEEAPRARDWLLQHSSSAADRPDALRRFVETFDGADEFIEEVRALRPITEGGGILYIVDGTQPYRDRHEAEMEILQWAARPRLALINRIRHPDSDRAERIEEFVSDWRNALSQYFSTVVEFDAHRATFAQRVEIFRTLAALDAGWRDPMRAAVDAMVRQRRQRNLEAAGVIAGLIADSVTYTAELTLEQGESPDRRKEPLREAFHAHLIELERKARRRIEKLYAHGAFGTQETPESALDSDLFSEESWSTFGLSPGALVVASGIGGAAAGGMADAAVGGLSGGAGFLIGGVAGAGTALYHLTRRFAEASVDKSPAAWGRMMSGERRLRIGPHPNPNFGWVLLDRALAHLEVVRNWAHARPTGDGADEEIRAHIGLAEELSDSEKRALNTLLVKLRKKHTAPPNELRVELERSVAKMTEEPER